MAGNTSRKSAKVAKKASAKRVAAKPTLLAGGNPQIANGEGDAPVQGCTGVRTPPATRTVRAGSQPARSLVGHGSARPSRAAKLPLM